MKKSVSQIMVERILEDIDKTNLLPWQRTYSVYYSFNYFNYNVYHGINRLLLPPGEYITVNQIQEYNKKNNVFYKYKKGIRFYPVLYHNVQRYEQSREEVVRLFPDVDWDRIDSVPECFIGASSSGYYYTKTTLDNGKSVYMKSRSFSRYTMAAERQYFENENGEELPSRVASGVVVLENAKADETILNYIKRSGVKMEKTIGYPVYDVGQDTVRCNITPTSSADYYCNLFHEIAHSTMKRLGRKLDYDSEECVAEICAGFCCAECGIQEYSTANSRQYENSLSYIQAYRKRIEDWGTTFLGIVGEADKAFKYIMGYE